MATVRVTEQHEVERQACDVCGRIIRTDPAQPGGIQMEWYRLKYVGWLGEQELWLCSILCAIKWAGEAQKALDARRKEADLT